jgi:hypothetical protein
MWKVLESAEVSQVEGKGERAGEDGRRGSGLRHTGRLGHTPMAVRFSNGCMARSSATWDDGAGDICLLFSPKAPRVRN